MQLPLLRFRFRVPDLPGKPFAWDLSRFRGWLSVTLHMPCCLRTNIRFRDVTSPVRFPRGTLLPKKTGRTTSLWIRYNIHNDHVYICFTYVYFSYLLFNIPCKIHTTTPGGHFVPTNATPQVQTNQSIYKIKPPKIETLSL